MLIVCPLVSSILPLGPGPFHRLISGGATIREPEWLDLVPRLSLLEALSAAADEITIELAPGSVEVRLRQGTPEFVVATPPAEAPAETAETPPPALPEGNDSATARTEPLRPPPHLTRFRP
jgi:hypothetical protein